jgi:hypothetical protein
VPGSPQSHRDNAARRSVDLHFRFARRVEITLGGGPDGGVFYHQQGFARGEDQTLRFTNHAWSYVVFQRYQAPRIWDAGTIEPEIELGGVLVMKDGKIIRRIDCDTGTSDMHEWSIFTRLKQDDENLTPDGA